MRRDVVDLREGQPPLRPTAGRGPAPLPLGPRLAAAAPRTRPTGVAAALAGGGVPPRPPRAGSWVRLDSRAAQNVASENRLHSTGVEPTLTLMPTTHAQTHTYTHHKSHVNVRARTHTHNAHVTHTTHHTYYFIYTHVRISAYIVCNKGEKKIHQLLGLSSWVEMKPT